MTTNLIFLAVALVWVPGIVFGFGWLFDQLDEKERCRRRTAAQPENLLGVYRDQEAFLDAIWNDGPDPAWVRQALRDIDRLPVWDGPRSVA